MDYNPNDRPVIHRHRRWADVRMTDGGPLLGTVNWREDGKCWLVSLQGDTWPDPRLDATRRAVVDTLIWAIEHGDPSGALEFVWAELRAALDDELVAGRDYEVAVCDNCGQVDHTPKQLVVCADSMLGPPRSAE